MAEAGYYYCETLLNLIYVFFFFNILDPFSFVFLFGNQLKRNDTNVVESIMKSQLR